METIQVGIESLMRGSANEPWKITFLPPTTDTRMTAVLGAGGMEVGPRLREVLQSIEEHQLYPRTITGRELELLGMATRDSFTIRVMNHIPTYIEIGFRSFRQFTKPTALKATGTNEAKPWEPDVPATEVEALFSPLANEPNENGSSFEADLNGTVLEGDYLVVGTVVEIKDGDTMDFKIKQVGSLADQDKDLKEGKTITVRFAGVNTPETREHGEKEGLRRNKEYMDKYDVTEDEAFDIGDEAMDKLTSFLSGDGYVALDMDAGLNGLPKTDKYGRYMAAVYQTSFTEPSEAFEGFTLPMLNKTLLGTFSSIKEDAPLAIPYYYFIDNEYSRLGQVDWLYDLGIRKRSEERIGERLKEKEAQKEKISNPITDGTTREVKAATASSNKIDFMEAYDDRYDDLYPKGNDHKVRIGDVMLTIPPLNITTNRTSSIQKVKTLRSKSSMMIKGGSSATTITLQLYFHDLESINGRRVKMHKDSDRYYYMDGLRPLIAQFKKAPFLPIDNVYINETLGIDSVALVNLSVQTVEGFPHSLAASLTLAKFEHEAYMPQLSRLGEGLNYPMLRWYYQEPLRDDLDKDKRSPYRTWLDPIPESGLTNNFKFLGVDEEDLILRKRAIENLRNMMNPLLMEERFENPATSLTSGGDGSDAATLYGQLFKDGMAAQRALDMYTRYMTEKRAGRIPTERDDEGNMKIGTHIAYSAATSSTSSNIGAPKPVSATGKKAWVAIYGEQSENNVMGKSHYAPFEAIIHRRQADYKENEGGLFKLRLYSPNNIDLFEDDEVKETNGNLTSVIFPGRDMHTLRRIIDRGKQAEDSYLRSIQEWSEAKAAVEATEAELTLKEWSVGGELIPLSVSVMYENQFSAAQLQAMDSPTLQFLGGQDPYVQVQFHADEIAVRDIRLMLEQTERFAREYRTGITSGFLGIENDLVQLFGITTIMPETVQVSTVPGSPGVYMVNMTLAGFNKTQKRTEALEGLSPIYGDTVDLESRKTGNYKEAADEAIIEYKMQKMELYPDLELPTYDELEAALPYMNANCTVYENRTGGIYVDPDFYMSTGQTAREIIDEQRNLNQEMTMSDDMGISMMTGSQYMEPLQGEDDMWSLLNAVDSRTQKIDIGFSWSGDVSDASGGDSNEQGITFKSKDIEEYVKDREALKTPPSYEEWKELGIGTSDRGYAQWLDKKKNPEEWEVYNEIYKWVDKLWTDEGLVYDDTDTDWKNKAWQKITYASIDDMRDVHYNKLVSKDADLIKDGKKERKLDNLTQKDYKATKSKPTRERIANIIKALFQERSRWRQIHSSGMPIIDQKGNAAGIGGVPISSEAEDMATAKRLLWDWKYNVEVAIKQLKEGYMAAADHKDIKYKMRPWDWMVAAYATGTIDTEIDNTFAQRVRSVFNSQYNKADNMYATPTSAVSLVILQQKQGYSTREMGVIKGHKGDIIETLMSMGYRQVKKDKWFGEDEYESQETTRKWLEKKTEVEVQEIYTEWTAQFKDQDYLGSFWLDLLRTEDTKQQRADNPKAASLDDYIEGGSAYLENVENNRLVNQSMPEDIFPDMFTDMLMYDQRMRLLRAFPTFQMFIVDEGRWMTNYRLWDNLYGFNAIQSIDIHKSRKIAADTAVIQMTNVYSNLTSRSLDTTYEEWDYKFWDNLVLGNPNEKLLEARKELMTSLLLQTGARIHLRLGYGSSANDLPVVFNGTITEMSAEEVVTIVCQGDGVELGNVISADPSDTNKNFLKVTEPRDLICELLTSKGNWFKDVMNDASDGGWFKDNPLGIQHFGQPSGKEVPEGTWKFFNHNYGESAQNIYSSNGMNTFSQWTMADGETDIPWTWQTKILNWIQPGDEDNVKISFYNNTTWDIIQTLAATSVDYIAAVHPFEMRSTLFFGKPYWRMAYTYDSKYTYVEAEKSWQRERQVEHRKPYAQFHIFSSEMDIIGNRIKASEEGVYTNVIVNYDGKQTPVLYADFDIRFDKQKTTVVDAEIVSSIAGLDFWTSEKQAMYHGISAVRDYMKDMYKGELLVLGDPTLKPHDLCYMQDTMLNMHGNFQVKAVTHSFSQETGFISSVQPDVLAVSDDMALLNISNWGLSLGAKFIGQFAAIKLGAQVIKRLIPSQVKMTAMKVGGAGATKATQLVLSQFAKFLPDDDVDVRSFKRELEKLKDLDPDNPKRDKVLDKIDKLTEKIEKNVPKWKDQGKFKNGQDVDIKGKGSYARAKRTVAMVRGAAKALKGGPKAIKWVRYAGLGIVVSNPLGMLAAAVGTWAVEGIAEKYRRKKAAMQCVLIMPLTYQGRQYTAGINGHKGMVVGDPMGKIDSFLLGMGFDGENGNGDLEWVMDTWNYLMDAEGKDFSVSEEDIRNGGVQSKDGDGGSFWSE